MDNKESIEQNKENNKTLLRKVIYRLLEVKGINNPVKFFGEKNYRRMRSVSQCPRANIRLSTICWLSKELDVPPKFWFRIIERSNKGKEGLNVRRTD